MNVSFAKAKAGHDKGEIYLVVKEEGECVYLVNGRTRTIDKPKRKKRKHIQPIYQLPEEVVGILKQDLTNEVIKRAIKEYLKYGKQA